MCAIKKYFDIILWGGLLEQSMNTSNLLSRSHKNEKLSAHQQISGIYYFNKTPLVPPGKKSVVYTPTGIRKTWYPYGEDSLYVGPSKEHYCCFKFYMVVKLLRSGRKWVIDPFLLVHLCMPPTNTVLYLQKPSEDLVQALQNKNPVMTINMSTQHTQTLK